MSEWFFKGRDLYCVNRGYNFILFGCARQLLRWEIFQGGPPKQNSMCVIQCFLRLFGVDGLHQLSYMPTVRTLSHTFRYNRTFAESSKLADEAWDELLPAQNGYFSHPTIAPQRSTLSVYHELHCLVGNIYPLSNEF